MADFAILFDMDGVIIDSNPFHTKALDIFLGEKGFQLTEEEKKTRLYGRANKDWINDLYNGSLNDDELLKLGTEKEVIWRELYKNDVKPVKGLQSFLDKLISENIPFCIGTSAPVENVNFTLEKLGFEKYFKTILHQAHVKKGKPDPEIYINCAKALHMNPENCIVIEDSLAGVKSGKAAGCKVIGITTTHTKEELIGIDYCITDFEELNLEICKKLMI
jgi:beta-phosphoglucomutase